ncbi:unnamed protein product [Malus baccata var. baccata]
MGSLPSPPRPSTAPPSLPNPNSLSNFRVFATFCYREPAANLNISNWIECYDPSTNMWTHASSIPGLTENHVLKGFAMVSLRDSVYIIGGYGMESESSRTMSIVHKFDISATNDAWTSMEPMEEDGEKELCGHCCVVQLS